MAVSENTIRVINYLKENVGVALTAVDVAEALDLETKQVNGIFTAGIQRKGLGIRTPAEIELEDGTHKAVKLLSLTDEGLAWEPTVNAD